MAVLGRLKIAPNQRLDLPDIVAFDAYSAGDWKGFLGAMVGNKPYLIKGFEVFQPNTLIGNPAGSVDIVIAASSLWWAEGTEGSFFVSLPDSENKSVTLITDATNYIEMTLTLSSRAEDARALWDPGANGGNGGEFTQVVDTESFLDVTITRNNTGFSDDKIPLAKVVVNSSNNVTAITDCRPMLFRLGTGGNSPDPLNDYIWRDDPVGYDRTDTPVTMTSPLDPNVFRGADKNIQSFKEWMDAVMSRLKEIDGGSKWFQASGGGSGGTGGALSLTNLFLDSQAGHSPQPDRKVTFAWSKNSDNKFRSENAVGYNQPAKWSANFGQIKWQLGGSFVSATNRAYSDFTFEVPLADNENLYLALQRDAALNGDPIVHFENLSGVTGFCSAYAAGSFTGVACGDYIRKESNNVYQYYRVAELRVNSGTPFTNGTVEGTVADATVAYLLLETHDGPITTTDEPYRFFRKSYSEDDLVASDIGNLDTSRYWLGRRFGSMFYLRDYGDMQPGEETEVLNDHDTAASGGSADIILERAYDSVYDPTNGYSLKGGGVTTLITIRRRLGDNTVDTPTGGDNSGSLLVYTINAPVGTMADGDTLWVRLGTSSSGLISGDVTDVTTDNVWEVRSATLAPLRSYDNKNVFMVARKLTIGGVECLVFADGFMLAVDGQWVNNHLSVEGDLFLKSFTQWSIPFISTADSKLGENNAEFAWDNLGGPDSLGELTVRNLRIGQAASYDVIDQDAQRDLFILPSLGAQTVKIGGSTSTIYIPGDLLVDGTTTSINTSILQVDDKVITVGVGNLSNTGYGSGVEVADDTRQASQIDSTNAQSYIDITYGAAHGYVLGNIVGVDSNTAVGGITAGQVSGSYTVVSSGSTAGDAEVISTTILRVWTSGTATSTASQALSPPTTSVRTYLSPWSIRVGDSSGAYSSGVTSWVFRVKGVATAPAITPVSGYGIVPTASSTGMLSGRIPFVGNDNAGPGGVDTTLDFSANLSWDGTNLSLGGGLVPAVDNTYDIGTTALRWKTLHVGPGSVVVHGDNTDTLKVQLRYSGSYGILDTDAASNLQITTGSNNGIRVGTSGNTSIGAAAVDSTALLVLSNPVGNTAGVVRVTNANSSPSIFTEDKTANGDDTERLYFKTGDTTAIATTGEIRIATGTASGSGDTGDLVLKTGSSTSGTAGDILIEAGLGGAADGKTKVTGTFTVNEALNTKFMGIGQATPTARLHIGDTSDTTAVRGILFGGGSSNLYRSAASTLKTDGNFLVGGALDLDGALKLKIGAIKTGNYSITDTDCIVIYHTGAAVADVTATLPSSAATNAGQVVIIKDTYGAVNQLNKAIIIAPQSGELIDNQLGSIKMTIPYFALTLVADGNGGWYIV